MNKKCAKLTNVVTEDNKQIGDDWYIATYFYN